MKKQYFGILAGLLVAIAACTPGATVTSVAVNAISIGLNPAATTTVSATVTGTNNPNPSVNWSIESGGGSLSATSGSSITFTAPTAPNLGNTMIKAVSIQDPSKSSTITIASGVVSGVGISASVVNVREGGSSTLTGSATASAGTAGQVMNWAIESGGVGTLSSTTGTSVTYTAPSSTFGRVVRITATSQQDSTQKKTIYLGVHTSKQSIAMGDNHTLVIKSDGTVISWGNDANGELGDGTAGGTNATPTAITNVNVTDIVAVSGGGTFSLALKANGTMLSWGDDTYQQLGNGAGVSNSATPTVVSGFNDIVAISAGYRFSLALRSNGTMLSWGNDGSGQLGDGTIDPDNPTPTPIPSVSGVVAIGAGFRHSLALKSDGTMLSWGQDDDGELGDGTINPDNPTPTAIPGVNGIIAIHTAGGQHSLALKSDGTMLSWGNDGSGQLGDGTVNPDNPTPTPIPSVSGVVAIGAGLTHSLALKSDGTMLSWGSDTDGQLGDGTTTPNNPTPTAISAVSGVVAIAIGEYASMALKSDGSLLTWGDDDNGQLGDGTVNPDRPTPFAVPLGGGVTVRLP